MKTFRILFVTFLSLVFFTSVIAAVPAPAQESVPSLKRGMKAGNLIKAVDHNGAYIPVVDLPLIEIVSTKTGSQVVKTIHENGKLLVEINLPEIEITATQYGARKMRSYIQNGEIVIISDLPMIEIGATFPYNNLISTVENKATSIPVVNLPEIAITPSPSDNFIVAARFKNGMLIPYINLPVIEISAAYSWLPVVSSEKFAFDDQEIEWIYISLKNCGITAENKIVCEVATQISSSDAIRTETIRLLN